MTTFILFFKLAILFLQSIVSLTDGRVFPNEHVVEIHAVAPGESENISQLKEKALEQIRLKRHVVNITEHVAAVHSVDFVVGAYSSPRLTPLEKSVRGMLLIGDVYYDKADKVVLVIPPGGGRKVRFLHVELDGNLYEVGLHEGD
ncbi:MAG: hypothetical protein MJ058_02065 [Akkermansia sp.]|nr:hypothetical protein [Akkermansia sp.]